LEVVRALRIVCLTIKFCRVLLLQGIQACVLHWQSHVELFKSFEESWYGDTKTISRVKSSFSYILESWLQDFFNNDCEKLPNKDIIHLLDSISKLKVWKIFKSSFSNFDKNKNISYCFFSKL
jgi:hypothetical protein